MPDATFIEWLADQADRWDPVGDLARDLAVDQLFRGQTAADLRAHLHAANAIPPVFTALDQAIEEFERR